MSSKALRPRYAARLIAGIWLVTVVVFGVVMRIVDPDTFDSIWLAFWWALQTITTVGYGDVVPGEPAGKAIGAVLMLGGLSLLSIITATITSAFITRRQADMQASGEDPVMRQLQQIESRLDGIDAELRRLSPPDSRFLRQSAPMADDYRIKVEFEDEGKILHFGRSLHEREFEQELREQLGDGVIVTRDGSEVFLYASTPEQAHAAEAAVREVLEHQDAEADVSPVERWHPVEERWEDASVPLPQTGDELADRARAPGEG